MSEFPSDWSVATLGEIATIKASNVDKKSKDGQRDVLLCNYMDVFRNPAISNSLAFMRSTASDKEISDFCLSKGDVLLTKDSEVPEEIGIPSVVAEDIPDLVCGYHLYMLRPDSDRIDPGYLCWTLRSNESRQYFYQMANGSTRFGLNLKHVEDCSVPIPPLPEQKKIAEVLSGIDTEINCLKEQTERCLRILLTISEDVFRNCKGKFPFQDLAKVCAVITKGATPTTFGHELSGIRFPGSVTFLGGGSTNDLGEFDQNPARYCTQEAVGTLKRSELRAGDTLITIVGASIGNTCQIPDYALPANINQNVALVRSNESVLDCNYLSLYLKTEGRKALVNIATTQAQPSVSLKQVGELQIPMPPTNEQRRISEAVTSIRSWKVQLDRKLHTMTHLKQALSADLLSGRKRVSI